MGLNEDGKKLDLNENGKKFRIADITTKNGQPVEELLKNSLPEGYIFKEVSPAERAGFYHKVIATPTGDEICLIISDDGLSAKTANIKKQDKLPEAPSFEDDELSKFANAVNQTTDLHVSVGHSDNDLSSS